MINRILVAVDDSPPALAAAAFAVDLARLVDGELCFVTVTHPGRDPEAMLRHVSTLADGAGVASTSSAVPDGQPYEALLDAVARWDADLVVMGRTDKRSSGRPYVGSQTEHLLEFADVPVVVVPERAP
jgi:nucleotide-binding universal stress UspA family protein